MNNNDVWFSLHICCLISTQLQLHIIYNLELAVKRGIIYISGILKHRLVINTFTDILCHIKNIKYKNYSDLSIVN